MLKKMQRVLGVLIASSLLCIQCATIKQPKQYSDKNVIKVYQSKNHFSGFVVDSYIDHEHKHNIPNTTYVNDVLLTNSNKPRSFDNVPSTVIKVKNNQKHKIQIFSMGYLPTKKIEIYVKRGDSVVVKSYLKRDKRIMYNYKKR